MNYYFMIPIGLVAAMAASAVIYGITKMPEEHQWILGPFVGFVLLTGLMCYLGFDTQKHNFEDAHRTYVYAQEAKQRDKERIAHLDDLESERYKRDVEAHGEQMARLKRIERRLDKVQ